MYEDGAGETLEGARTKKRQMKQCATKPEKAAKARRLAGGSLLTAGRLPRYRNNAAIAVLLPPALSAPQGLPRPQKGEPRVTRQERFLPPPGRALYRRAPQARRAASAASPTLLLLALRASQRAKASRVAAKAAAGRRTDSGHINHFPG